MNMDFLVSDAKWLQRLPIGLRASQFRIELGRKEGKTWAATEKRITTEKGDKSIIEPTKNPGVEPRREELTMTSHRRAKVFLVITLKTMVSMLSLSCVANMPRWAAAHNPNTGVRFIPVELWTGAEWDGANVIRMSEAGLAFGERGEKGITGPFEWTRPQTGERLLVYERTNRDKRQLFTITNDGTGLGRVYDSRYGRDCDNEVKFPLGYWKQGETRVYEVQCNGLRKPRPLMVTIEELDFVYKGIPHSLRFHWLIDEGRGRGTDMVYTYSPGRGLVDVHGNE